MLFGSIKSVAELGKKEWNGENRRHHALRTQQIENNESQKDATCTRQFRIFICTLVVAGNSIKTV